MWRKCLLCKFLLYKTFASHKFIKMVFTYLARSFLTITFDSVRCATTT